MNNQPGTTENGQPAEPLPEVEPNPQNPSEVSAEPPPFPTSPALPTSPPALSPPPTPLLALAGLETGLLGAAIMFGWFVLYSYFDRQYWWGMLNLWGVASFGNKAFNMGFGLASLAGAGHHLFLHGVGGAFAALGIGRLRGFWLQLAAAIAAAALWYLFATRIYWPSLAPAVVRVSPQPATLLAYLLYGATLSRAASRARDLERSWQK